MTEQKYDADRERAAMDYHLDMQNGINRSAPNRLYSKEQIEEWASKRADDAGRLSRQFLDIIRENERLREALGSISGKLPYGFLIAGESKLDALQRILNRNEELAKEALSNKDTSHEN